MKTLYGLGLFALVSVAACMHTPPPQDPENTEDDSSGDSHEEGALGSGNGVPARPKGDHAVIKDEGKKDAKACSGANITDLLSVISQKACEVPKASPDNEKERDLKDSLEVKATIDQPTVAPGGKASVTLTLHNKGKTDLPLDFLADPEPRVELELYTLKGGRADNPQGAEPSLPSSVQDQGSADRVVTRVTIAPGGTATMVIPWDAVKYKWASAERAKGALPGQHYPREVAGPLGKGKFAIKVVTPLIGITEGGDHEVTQPRIPVEVH
jgi:hypothetical protein